MRVARQREPPDDRSPSASTTKTAASGSGARPSGSGARRRRCASRRSSSSQPSGSRPTALGERRRAPPRRRGGAAGSSELMRRRAVRRRGAGRRPPSSVPSAPQLDGRDAAEEEVPARPAHDLQAACGESGASVVGPAALEMDRPSPRRGCAARAIASVDRLAVAITASTPARSHLRAAPSRRCRARAWPAVLEHERRRHHARAAASPGARGSGADHVELAEHVVELCAAAKDTRAGTQCRRERGGVHRRRRRRRLRRSRQVRCSSRRSPAYPSASARRAA